MTTKLGSLRSSRFQMNQYHLVKGIDYSLKSMKELFIVNEDSKKKVSYCFSDVNCAQAKQTALENCAEKKAAYLKGVASAGYENFLTESVLNGICPSK